MNSFSGKQNEREKCTVKLLKGVFFITQHKQVPHEPFHQPQFEDTTPCHPPSPSTHTQSTA